MQDETPAELKADISEWASGAHHRAAGLAEMLDVTPEQYDEDPLTLLPGLQNYADRLPLGEFEQSDWITLHTDLTAYLGDLMVRRYGAAWVKVSDPSSPAGYRYLIEANGLDGAEYRIEPYDIVMEEFEHLPIEIGRMIANAQAVLRVAPAVSEDSLDDQSVGDAFPNEDH
ncbi:hypothetical protein [Streptomyces sp. NPDC048669]|uniref:hypothetical protein n=1 Tax=Streptomyces sp. NPDC048669 TaxID=3155267 RepID=UPI003442E838